MEPEVRTPGGVHGERDAVGVGQFRVRRNVGDTADVTRLDEHDGLGVRVFLERIGNATDGHTGGQARLLVDVGADPDGHEAGQDDAEEQRLVDRARDDHLVARLTEREADRLVAM